jgi:hypothetical protein
LTFGVLQHRITCLTLMGTKGDSHWVWCLADIIARLYR